VEAMEIMADHHGIAAHAMHLYAGNDLLEGHDIKDLPKEYHKSPTKAVTSQTPEFIRRSEQLLDTTFDIAARNDGWFSFFGQAKDWCGLNVNKTYGSFDRRVLGLKRLALKHGAIYHDGQGWLRKNMDFRLLSNDISATTTPCAHTGSLRSHDAAAAVTTHHFIAHEKTSALA